MQEVDLEVEPALPACILEVVVACASVPSRADSEVVTFSDVSARSTCNLTLGMLTGGFQKLT